MMRYQFHVDNYVILSIVSNRRGKYYTLMTDEELLADQNQPTTYKSHLVARLTKRELLQFSKISQTELHLSEPPVDP